MSVQPVTCMYNAKICVIKTFTETTDGFSCSHNPSHVLFLSRFALGLLSLVSFSFLSFFFCARARAAIKTALKQENLNPEIEEKLLLQLQRYQERQSKQEPDVPATISTRVSTPSVRPPARKRPPSASKVDEDWVMETPKRTRPSRNSESRRDEIG